MTFNIHRSVTTETLCRLVLLFYVSFLCFWFFFKKEKYTLKNAWLSLKSATCVFPLTAYQDFTEFLSNHSFGKITPYLGCFSAHTGVKIRSLDLMKTIYQFEWRVIFLPNLVLANYHPSVSSPLSFINYQLMKVKGNPGFLWEASHPHIFFNCSCCITGWRNTLWQNVIYPFLHTWACRCRQLPSVALIDRGMNVCHPSHPDCTANSGLLATDGWSTTGIQTFDLCTIGWMPFCFSLGGVEFKSNCIWIKLTLPLMLTF